MRCMLTIWEDESVILSPAELHALPQIQAWTQKWTPRGIQRGGARLRPSSDAATVRVRDGEVLVFDGPFAETKEQVGGFDIIGCASLDEAIEIAARHPAIASGAIEVMRNATRLRPARDAPRPGPTPSPRHPSWKHRALTLPTLAPLTMDAPSGWMSCRPARTRPRAGSTRSGPS